MRKWKRIIPEGTRDILFQDCADKRYVEQSLNNVYTNRGFLEIITPTLEYYDVFDSEKVWIEQETMYKLFDNNGRIMVLRPDITTPVARLSGTKLKDSYYPLKFCYCQNVFRVNENLNVKKNEFTQSGVEIIGCGDLRADVEVIVTAIKALLEVGVEKFKVELGQVHFFKGIIEELPLEESDKERIREYIENKNFGSLRDFLGSKSEIINQNSIKTLNSLPALFGDIDVLDKARKLTENAIALEALENIEKIYNTLDSMGLSQYVSVDLGMVHHIDYYTGLIFRAYIEGAGDDVLYGGRYDGLVSNFGVDVPATGFAINVDRILEVLSKQGKEQHVEINADYLVYCDYELLGKANYIMESLIKNGDKCELSLFGTLKETIEYAEKKKIKNVVVINGESDIKLFDVEEGSERNFEVVEG